MRTIALFCSIHQLATWLMLYLKYTSNISETISNSDMYHSFNVFSFSFDAFIDPMSLWMVFLTLVIQILCIFHLNKSSVNNTSYLLISSIIISTTFILIKFFFASDLFWMYVWFEAILIPFFIYIGLFGPGYGRVESAYYLFFFTFVGSLPLFATIVYLYTVYGTTNLYDLSCIHFSLTESRLLFIATFLTIMVKIPCYPFHIWLPRAHVEAPTLGSIILAALLLKTGTFAIIRIIIPLYGDSLFFFQSFIFVICLISMIYAGLNALRETDIKRIIALSSIVHMSFCSMGLFYGRSDVFESAYLIMLGHGFISTGLFYSVGCLYDRYATRDLNQLGSLWDINPTLAFYFFAFIAANFAFPGTINFIPELSILWGLFDKQYMVTFSFFFGYFFNTIFNIWLLIRLLYGPYINLSLIGRPEDLVEHESIILFILLYCTIFFAFMPNIVYSTLHYNVEFISYLTNLT